MSDELNDSRQLSLPNDLGGPLQVDLLAASLRADATDLKAFMEALANKLAGALPNATAVTRQNKLFSREHPVREVVVTLGDFQYRISYEPPKPLQTLRAKIVRGIVLKTEQLHMEQWIIELAEDLAHEAAQSAQAHAALERFLL